MIGYDPPLGISERRSVEKVDGCSATAAAQWQTVLECDTRNPREAANGSEHPVVVAGKEILVFPVVCARVHGVLECIRPAQPHGQHAAGVEVKRYGEDVAQTPDEESRANEQHDGERHLRRREQRPSACIASLPNTGARR